MIDRGTGTLEKTSGPGKNDPFQERYNQLDHNQTLSDNYQQFIDKLNLTPDKGYTHPLSPLRKGQFGQLSPVEERIADRRALQNTAFSGDKMIARAQANLAIAGYELDGEGFKGVNGKEGPKTTQAVKDFQTAAGLKPTGIIDQETLKAMDLAAEKGMTRKEIEALGNQIAQQNEQPPVGNQPREHQLTPELTPQEQQRLAKRDDLVKQAYSTTKGGNYQLAQAQASLELAGYKLEKHGIDGKMGDETRANLRQFQKDWGIPETSDFYETYYALREVTVKEWKRPPEQKVEQEPRKQPVKEPKSELTPKLEKEDTIPHYTGTYDKAAQFNRIGKILPPKNFVYDQVKDSQTKLKEMGFNIGPAGADGKAGKYTREAVIEFQKMNKIEPTGELNKVTVKKIESEYEKGAVVKKVGQVLNEDKQKIIIDKQIEIKNYPGVETPGGSRIKDHSEAKSENLISIKGFDKNYQLDYRAVEAYRDMVEQARRDGIEPPLLEIVSGYRGDNHQKQLYNEKYNALKAEHPTWDSEKLAQETRKWVAPPGGSPHRTGRAIDLNMGIRNDSRHAELQKDTEVYKWLKENAQKYGFYNYEKEPWHWEYNPPSTK